jgi:hypothetical protein
MPRISRTAAAAPPPPPAKESREEAFERLTQAPAAALKKACKRLRNLGRTREGAYTEEAVEALFKPLIKELNGTYKSFLFRLGAYDED